MSGDEQAVGEHYRALRAARSMAREGRQPVLVIDDEYGARLQVEVALMTSDTVGVVGMASDGSRGAELAEQLQPKVIVLDLSMPIMDGFEALPLLRAVAPRATILVRSGSDDPEAIDAAMRLGAVGFVPKFLAPDELRAIIERAAVGDPSPLLAQALRRRQVRRNSPRRPATTRARS